MNTHASENYSVYPGEFVPVMNEENIIEESRNAEDDNINPAFVNIIESRDGYEVNISAPGLSREKLIVFADDNLLLVCTSQNERIIRDDNGFHRHINLPANADTELAVAEYRNSVLYLHVPKSKQTCRHSCVRIVVY